MTDFSRCLAASAALAAAVILSVLSASTAFASTEHALDPTLSLGGVSGAAGTNSFDSVPDPGSSHPELAFDDPCGVATDAYGDIYVANGSSTTGGEDGRIDVFNANGEFITEITNSNKPCSLTVDSSGRLYVYLEGTFGSFGAIVRYDPTVYQPAAGEIDYGSPFTIIAEGSTLTPPGAYAPAVNPANDHLYIVRGGATSAWVEDWTKEQEEGSPGTNRFGQGEIPEAKSIAVSGGTEDIYVAGSLSNPFEPRVYVIDGSTRKVKQTLDGSGTPDGSFGFIAGFAGVAVDQKTGDFYVGDVVGTHHVVDQFAAPKEIAPGAWGSETYLGQLKLGTSGLKHSEQFNGVAVDEGENSPNRGYVYVTSGSQPSGSHLYTFAPVEAAPPSVQNESAEVLTGSEVVLTAELNPHGSATSYRFEYGAADCASSPCQSAPATPAEAGSGGAFQIVSTPVSGLLSGTKYHFRIVATSHCNPAAPEEECVIAGPDASFTTFPAPPEQTCPNSLYRVGPSAHLPDCRAYELVTPSETNGRFPGATVFGEGTYSPPVPLASPDGESLLFGTEGGALPGLGGGGFHDAYLATRGTGTTGWHSEFVGLDGAQAQEPYASGESADHGYSFWTVVGTKGMLADAEGEAQSHFNYLREPGGVIEPIGVGDGGTIDRSADGRWISPDARHVIFTSTASLAAGAAPSGTEAIYDRSPGGSTHVISLKPGDEAFGATEGATYRGTSADGSAVAFSAGETLYVRLDDKETMEVATGDSIYGGLSATGDRAVYLRRNAAEPSVPGSTEPSIPQGQIFACDVRVGPCSGPNAQTPIPIGSGEKSVLVNVSADGSRVYFLSRVILTGTERNSQGAKAVSGKQNLYVWDGSSETVRFIATVETKDVVGELPPAFGGNGVVKIGGLGQWVTDAVAEALDQRQGQFVGPANDPSRTNADGGTFVFESRAELAGYENEGHSEIYRYDYGSSDLSCVSCSPIGAPAASDARIESRYAPRLSPLPPVNAVSTVENVVAGGGKVFFQSADRLVPGDLDGKIDVYEWEAHGAGGCASGTGCLSLISAGRSAEDEYLYAVGDDGRDVFLWSGDLLTAQDLDGAPSIYDAREGGGLPAPPTPPGECLGEACQPSAVARDDATPGSSSFMGSGNLKPHVKSCHRSKHKGRARRGRRHCGRRRHANRRAQR